MKIKQNKIIMIIRRWYYEKDWCCIEKDSSKKMIIDGEPWDKIMDETHLRLKDLKRIQRDEIDPHF